MTKQRFTTALPSGGGPARYGPVALGLHWLTFVLVFTQIALGFQGALLPPGFDKLVVLARHKSLGITIFGLTAVRLVWRAANPPPEPPAAMSRLERRAARISHGALYVLLLTMPIAGWLGSSASGISVSWFDVVALPDLLGPNKALAHLLFGIHALMAWLLIAILGLHIGAALWHHFVKRDTVLRRMLPGAHRGGSP